MEISRLGMLGFVCLAFVATTMAPADEEPRRSPKFEGDSLPVPPKQNEPWTPPASKLPEIVMTATKTLFAEGLPDPRGCEYRDVELGGGHSVLKTHAWVLPASKADSPRFAIGWDGLIYPVLKIGEPVELKIDVGMAIQKGTANGGNKLGVIGFIKRMGRRQAPPPPQEAPTVEIANLPTSLVPIKIAFLVRLGEEKLALPMWEALLAGNVDETFHVDPYPRIMSDWLDSLYRRALVAHQDGDDRLALVTLRALVPLWKKSAAAKPRNNGEDEVEVIGAFQDDEAVDGNRIILRRNLPDDLAPLLADQERRAKAPKSEKPKLDGLDQAARIAMLIEWLDEANTTSVDAMANGSGNFQLRDLTAARDLIKEGEAAIEPLLKVYENDERLSRFTNEPFAGLQPPKQPFSTVREIACDVLYAIFDVETLDREEKPGELDRSTPEGMKLQAALFRDHWNRNRGLAPTERWYRTLADDSATAEAWLQAASRIVQPAGSPRTPYRQSPDIDQKRDPKTKLAGHELRSKVEPSVAELMARRSEDLIEREFENRRLGVTRASDMAMYLAQWDLQKARPTLKKVGARLLKVGAIDQGENENAMPLGEAIENVTITRCMLGDREALDDYASWFPSASAKEFGFGSIPSFGLIAKYPKEPAMIRLAEWAFHDPASPWIGRLREDIFGGYNLVASPLIASGPFRRRVLALLEDLEEYGTVEVTASGGISLQYQRNNGGGSMGTSGGFGDPLAPRPNVKVNFRICDFYAWRLSELDGAPACAVYWPVDRRDEARARLIAFLKQYGDRYGPVNESHHPFFNHSSSADLSLPPLDHPASLEDVTKGLAVFSLEGEGERRVVALRPFPRPARWKNLKTVPYQKNESGDSKKLEIAYRQEGMVWQAEEVLKDGKWVLFYGFIGPHALVKVPASEIEWIDQGDPK